MGGLTVLKALMGELPHESFIYLGDTARLPYGTKSKDTVEQYAIQMARLLVERGIKALVIACNTATTAALPHLQRMLADIPVIGVVAPGAQAALQATHNNRIVVLATETTIASQAYQLIITQQQPDALLHVRACNVLVALAEEGMIDNAIAKAALQHYLQGVTDEDTVLLGCTHFPVFKPMIQSLLPHQVNLVDAADATAKALKNILLAHDLLHPMAAARIQYLVTDSVRRFQQVGQIFLHTPLQAQQIELIDA